MLGNLELIGTLVTTAVLSLGAGVTIGIVVGNKKITNEWWDCVKKRYVSRRDPQMICPHVEVEQRDDGEFAVIGIIPWQSGDYSDDHGNCTRCNFYSENRRGVELDVEMWKSNPKRAQKRIAKAEKAARRNNGWSNRWYERDRYSDIHK